MIYTGKNMICHFVPSLWLLFRDASGCVIFLVVVKQYQNDLNKECVQGGTWDVDDMQLASSLCESSLLLLPPSGQQSASFEGMCQNTLNIC